MKESEVRTSVYSYIRKLNAYPSYPQNEKKKQRKIEKTDIRKKKCVQYRELNPQPQTWAVRALTN